MGRNVSPLHCPLLGIRASELHTNFPPPSRVSRHWASMIGVGHAMSWTVLAVGVIIFIFLKTWPPST